MSRPAASFSDLAALLAYPRPGFREAVREASLRLSAAEPAAAPGLEVFRAFVAARSETDAEELFTRTFDLDAALALEIGWHLYGEEYKRGEFLVEMRGRMRELGIAEDAELPDHLSHVLEVLDQADAREGAALAREKVLPALAKMRSAAEGNPYQDVLRAVEICLESRFAGGRA